MDTGMGGGTGALLFWFFAVLLLIPLTLWAIKRTPWGSAASTGNLRVLSSSTIGPGQRIVVVEMGEGGQRQKLVLGVTAHHINLLQSMPAQADAARP